MHLSIHNWMRAEPIETTLQRISRIGYDSIEIQGAPQLYDTAVIRQQLKSYGLKCWGSVTLMEDGLNLMSGKAEERANTLVYLKSLVDMVKELDGHMLSVVPGTVGKIVPDSTPEQEWKWAVAGMQELYEHAEKAGVLLGIEPINRFETYFVNRAAQAYALAEATGPNCGVCLDIYHMNLEEADWEQALRDSADRLHGFHVADNNRMAPGMGALDWSKIIAVLKDIGYDGAVSVEFCPPLDRTPANPYPGSIDENPVGLSPEQKKFLEDHGSSAFTEEFYTRLTQQSYDVLAPLL
ncbi:sugar phosphate isomerase/epimerase [Lewinella sp. 4G2]|uniref:sugar phosphate isomerase/epimerase family protein n=1 Tax=Lewinella sp. 4G2 TaxID=1803372 RepID=UPI0007B49F96|nr:sugar phosphate isomerase/epimerase [Lewinella sp. 4G2]OAV46031.1 epimerase [Lewinella sp. 4G2]